MNIISILIRVIQYAAQLLSLIVIIDIFLSYFMDPFNPVRRFLDQIVQPLLTPIRRIVPPLGMLDLSPLVLLILVQIVSSILVQLLASI